MSHPYFVLLRDRQVLALWVGLAISSLGSELYRIGAVWLAADLAGANASWLVTAQSGAILAASVLVGPFTEMVPRRRLLIAADLLAAAASLAAVILAASAGLTLPVLIAASVVLAAIGVAHQPVLMSSLPQLVSRERLRDVNGLFDTTMRAAHTAGPVLAATALGFLPAIHLLTANAISFLASAVAIARTGDRLGRDAPAGSSPRFLSRLARGVSAANGCPGAWPVLIATSVRGAGYALSFTVGVPVLFVTQGPASAGAVAMVFAAAAAGELLANPLLVLSKPRLPLRRQFEGYALIGMGLLAVGAAALSFDGAAQVAAMSVGAFVAGVGGAVGGLQLMTFFSSQLASDDQAAVLRLRLTLIVVATATATAAGPWILSTLGPANTLVVCGAVVTAAGVFGALLPVSRTVRF